MLKHIVLSQKKAAKKRKCIETAAKNDNRLDAFKDGGAEITTTNY
jgi:hypothetical protein